MWSGFGLQGGRIGAGRGRCGRRWGRGEGIACRRPCRWGGGERWEEVWGWRWGWRWAWCSRLETASSWCFPVEEAFPARRQVQSEFSNGEMEAQHPQNPQVSGRNAKSKCKDTAFDILLKEVRQSPCLQFHDDTRFMGLKNEEEVEVAWESYDPRELSLQRTSWMMKDLSYSYSKLTYRCGELQRLIRTTEIYICIKSQAGAWDHVSKRLF